MELSSLWRSEDWWACWLGFSLFLVSFIGLVSEMPKLQIWSSNPLESLIIEKSPIIITLMFGLLIIFTVGIKFMNGNPKNFAITFVFLFSIGYLAQLIASQQLLKTYGFEYVFWALLIGIFIRNVFGIPKWLRDSLKTELFIKTGLVLLGAEILFSVILNLGLYGLIIAWGVTPIVLYFTYLYGTRKYNLEKSFALLISAATSVCGVSAAIAMASASKAKKEHLTITISMSLIFTVIMLVGMPLLIKATEINTIIGGAWIGGTIDSSGAVVAAGELLGKEAMEVAIVIKMIQNMMIGILAFVVAVIWVLKIDRNMSDEKPSILDIWYRFPKFILGFVTLSLVTSFLLNPVLSDTGLAELLKVTGGFRTIFFSIAFVSIGLETGFKELGENIEGRNPLKLYLLGQFINVVLTFIFAWFFFDLLPI